MTCCEVVPPIRNRRPQSCRKAFGNRLQHAVMGQRRRIAVALDLEFRRRHGKRHVDGEHELDVHRLGGQARQAVGRPSTAMPANTSPRRRNAGTTMKAG